MATTTTKPDLESVTSLTGVRVPGWQESQRNALDTPTHRSAPGAPGDDSQGPRPRASQHDALQALLAFSALHEQLRRRNALAARHNGFEKASSAEFEPQEHFLLDEVLQLVAERAVAITGADGLAIALAENDEIVLRAAAGTVRPDVGARIDRNSAFSGACFREAQVVTCDDTETDPRVNPVACRKLGARSMIAVPLCGRRRVIGVLEAFFAWPFGFNDSDIRNLTLLAELILGALKPEDEDRYADSAQVAQAKLEAALPRVPASVTSASTPPLPAKPVPPEVVPRAPIAGAKPVVLPSKPEIALPTEVAPPKAAPPLPKPKTQPAPAISTPATNTAEPPAAPSTSANILAAMTKAPLVPAAATKPISTDTRIAPAPSTPAVITKPRPAEPAPATTASLSPKSAEPQKAVETPATQELPAPRFGQLEPERKTLRPALLYVLVFIVIVSAFAGGVWWKIRTVQLGSEMVQPQTHPTEKATPSSTKGTGTAPAVPVPPPPSQTPSLAISEDNESSAVPATPQELAKFPRVSGIRHWSSANTSTVVLDLEDQVQYEPHRLSNPDRIYFDLYNTQLAADLTGKSIEIGDGLLNRIRVAQPVVGMTRIVLETRGNPDFSVSLEPNPYRLVVEVRKPGSAPKDAVNLFPNAEAKKNTLAIVVPPPTKEDLQLRARVPKLRIVVDAGHGGWDLGTVGRRGLLEKDLVLEIAQRLGKLLESRLGADVIYTRQDDNYIPLDDRAAIANQAQADLFISVHANYSDLASARGVETYYTNFFSAPGSKEAGSKPAAMAAGTASAAPTLTPADLHERVEQSRRLAISVQRSLYGTLSASNPGLRDRGVREAAFIVLTESAMPGILAEVSFVSSPTDEQKLRSDGYREQIAEALYRGVARYAASSKGVKLASKQLPVASSE